MRALEDLWESSGAEGGDDVGVFWEMDIERANGEVGELVPFETMESILSSLPDVTSVVLQERLEILIGDGDYHGWCVQIDGIDHIRVYCDTGNPWLVPTRWTLSLVKDTRCLPDIYCASLKCSVVKELEEDAVNVPRSWWGDVPKYHRLKKIYEHKHVDTGIVYQVTLERVMTDNAPSSLKSSLEQITPTAISHNVRARWRHNKNKSKPPPSGEAARTFYGHGMRLAAIARNEPVPMRLDEHGAVLVAFGKLIVAARRRPRPGEPRDERPFFLAPKPVTLEQVHLIDPETRYGAVSIQGDYCVTDKADGERMLFYVHNDGK